MTHKLVRLMDGVKFEFVRYQNTPGSLNEIAWFILGVNPENSTSIANERMLDVVRVSQKEPGKIEVADWTAPGAPMRRVTSGQWLLKSPGQPLLILDEETVDTEFSLQTEEAVIPDEKEIQELTSLICEYFPMTTKYRAKAVATKIVRAGWSRREDGL